MYKCNEETDRTFSLLPLTKHCNFQQTSSVCHRITAKEIVKKVHYLLENMDAFCIFQK